MHAATKRRRRLGNILRLSFALNVGRNGDGTTLISASKISGYHGTLAVIDVDCLYFPSFFSLFSSFSPSFLGHVASGVAEDSLGWGDGGWSGLDDWGFEEGQGR